MNGNATLLSGLEAIAAELVPGRSRRALQEIVQHLRDGDDLADIEKIPGVADELVAIVRAGESSSTIEQTLRSVMAFSREQLYSRPRLPLAVTYALFVLACAVILYFAVLAFLVPIFSEVFWTFEVSLPRAAAMLSAQGRFVTAHPWLCSVSLLFLAVAAVIAVRRLPRWLSGTTIGFSIPGIGPWLKVSSLARFSCLTATLLRCGLELPEALRRSSRATVGHGLASAADQLAQHIEDGKEFNGFDRGNALPKALLLVASHCDKGTDKSAEKGADKGADKGAMNADLFDALGEMYRSRSTDQMAVFEAVAGPFVFVLVGILVIFIVSALYGPLIVLIQNLT
jgi:type IV pilus assembly protein PilC